jgi:hypothetical protein
LTIFVKGKGADFNRTADEKSADCGLNVFVLMLVEPRTHTEVTSFPRVGREDTDSLPQNGDPVVHHGTVYEIGRIFSRVHSALGGPTPEGNGGLWTVSFGSESVTVHTIAPFVTRRHLPTGLMKPKFKSSKCFFYGASTVQLGCPGNPPA